MDGREMAELSHEALWLRGFEKVKTVKLLVTYRAQGSKLSETKLIPERTKVTLVKTSKNSPLPSLAPCRPSPPLPHPAPRPPQQPLRRRAVIVVGSAAARRVRPQGVSITVLCSISTHNLFAWRLSIWSPSTVTDTCLTRIFATRSCLPWYCHLNTIP